MFCGVPKPIIRPNFFLFVYDNVLVNNLIK